MAVYHGLLFITGQKPYQLRTWQRNHCCLILGMSGVRNSARCTDYPRASLLFNKPNRSTLSTSHVLCSTNLKTHHTLSREKQLHVTRAIPGVSTIRVQISEVTSQHKNKEEISHQYIYVDTQFSRKSRTTVDFSLWEKLKTLVYSAPKVNRHFSNACQIIHNGSGTYEMARQSTIRRWRTFSALFVNCDMINNTNSTVMKLGTCIVNVLCQR